MDAPLERVTNALDEIDGVVVVDWPEDAERATDHARLRTPHLFLVAPGTQPPDKTDDLSAWIRLPAAERDIQERIVELRSRAGIVRPILGEHGILWRGTQRVALSPIEARLTAAFVARPGRVLSRARLEQTVVTRVRSNRARECSDAVVWQRRVQPPRAGSMTA